MILVHILVGVEESIGPLRDFFRDTGLKDQESWKNKYVFDEIKFWNVLSLDIRLASSRFKIR